MSETTSALVTTGVPSQSQGSSTSLQKVVPPAAQKGVTPQRVTPAHPQRTSLQEKVVAQEAPKATPKALSKGTTNSLKEKAFFRCVLYSETSARKTTIAAHFAGSKFTRIILTRSEDQLIPLEGEGYEYVYCPDSESLTYAMKYPERLWPEWASMDDPDRQRTLVVDDLTKAVSILVESNKGSKDNRQAYTGALSDLDSLILPLTRKPYNLILVSLAKVKENPISGEDRIGPDLSPSILGYVTAEFAAVLYVQTKNWKLLTERDRFTVVGVDPGTGKEKPYVREVFAKVKVPFSAALKKMIPKEVEPDLKLLWGRIKEVNR